MSVSGPEKPRSGPVGRTYQHANREVLMTSAGTVHAGEEPAASSQVTPLGQ
jgi:hypothetical protein